MFLRERGQVISQLRGEKQFSSQAELADAAGVSVGVVERAEKGLNVRADKLASIAAALSVTVDELNTKAGQRKRELRAAPAEDHPTALGFSSSELKHFFDAIDGVVNDQFGLLYSPTQNTQVTFSTRRLFSSLSIIDIPPEIILEIISSLPDALASLVSKGTDFKTSHVRLAVANIISTLPPSALKAGDSFAISMSISSESSDSAGFASFEERKFDWVKRYCRRYGDPSRVMTVLEDDGSSSVLDFSYLKTTIVPHMIKRLLGEHYRLDDSVLITKVSKKEMAKILLDEFRRLNLYTIRYRTAIWLAEEIAIQPPHPWLVTPQTRMSTVRYDIERVQAHIKALNSGAAESEHWHRYTEIIHHCCSAILGTCGGFIGHKYLFPLHVLRHWLSIKENNIPLWNFCELRLIDGDLFDVGLTRSEFSAFLKRIEVGFNAKRPSDLDGLIKASERLHEIAVRLFSRRETMRLTRSKFGIHSQCELPELLTLSKEAVVAVFKSNKPRAVKDRVSGQEVGFYCSIDFAGTALSNRSSLCVFVVSRRADTDDGAAEDVARLVDMLNAHRLAQVAILIVGGRISDATRNAIDAAGKRLDGNRLLFAVELSELFSIAQRSNPFETAMEELLGAL